MKILAIDIETYSDVDLKSCGVYAYTASPNFEILLFAYAFDNEPVKIIDLTCELLPKHIIDALFDKSILKMAYNANFERTCISAHLKEEMDPSQWWCTAVHASMLGLPQHLAGVAMVLDLPEQKMEVGKALIRYFSVPCKPTKVNGGRTRNLPGQAPEKWEDFKEYCKMDVEVERALRYHIEGFKIPDQEKKLWYLDQKIIDRGVLVDIPLIDIILENYTSYKEELEQEAINITGLDNPGSVAQLKTWLGTQNITCDSLTKETVPEILSQTIDPQVKRVLEIRQELSKASITKYDAMKRAVCPDGRVKGLLQFYGANRTGRWAGRIVQVHNLPRNDLKDLDLARELVRSGKLEEVDLLFGNVSDTLSQLIRTAFIARPKYTFLVADFSAIEARVIAWMAGESWRLDVFNTHGKIYEASAAAMFKVPIESIDKHSPLRQKGKIAELALGYQGGAGALIQMGALNMGLTEEELPDLVDAWRKANKRIVLLWNTVGKAAITAVKEHTHMNVGPVTFKGKNNFLFVKLPSGRNLSYFRPKLKKGRWGDVLTYEGVNQTNKKWEQVETYGGKLVENIVQAIARDCLADVMLRLDDAGYRIVMHVHDEVVIECGEIFAKAELEKVLKMMGEPIEWAPGLPLKGDGYTTEFYKKD